MPAKTKRPGWRKKNRKGPEIKLTSKEFAEIMAVNAEDNIRRIFGVSKEQDE